MLIPIRETFIVFKTDGVRCFRLACGHERILSTGDARKLEASTGRVWCAECERTARPGNAVVH